MNFKLKSNPYQNFQLFKLKSNPYQNFQLFKLKSESNPYQNPDENVALVQNERFEIDSENALVGSTLER